LHVTFLRKPAQTRKNDAQFLRKIERHNEILICQYLFTKFFLPTGDFPAFQYRQLGKQIADMLPALQRRKSLSFSYQSPPRLL